MYIRPRSTSAIAQEHPVHSICPQREDRRDNYLDDGERDSELEFSCHENYVSCLKLCCVGRLRNPRFVPKVSYVPINAVTGQGGAGISVD